MSAEATGWVYRFSPFAGATFWVHQAIADSVNDQHENLFWMGQGRLARKARVSRRSAQRALDVLLGAKFVELDAAHLANIEAAPRFTEEISRFFAS